MPATYLRAASWLGIDPAACVVLEDAPNGIAASVAAGMHAIAVPNVYTRDLPFVPPPEAVLPDLAAVIPWLQLQERLAFQSTSLAGQELPIEDELKWQMHQVIV